MRLPASVDVWLSRWGRFCVRASDNPGNRIDPQRYDFDFLVGTWKLRNRKLKSRLSHSTEWKSFESHVEMHQILNGFENIDKYTDQASGKLYEGVAMRLFDPATRLWSYLLGRQQLRKTRSTSGGLL
jgi:hypothetical protein